MKFKSVFFLVILIVLLTVTTGCSNRIFGKSTADWNSSFVVWDGYMYKISDEYVVKIDSEIGKVEIYSDMVGTYSGNFSNVYEKGTMYYSITGISTDEAIAIQELDGNYRKAIRDGKYGEK